MLKTPDEWFEQVEYDLKTVEALIITSRFIYAVFICHLAIEKALKGLYTKRMNDHPPRTHNLLYFIKKLGILPPKNLEEFINEVNRVSVPTRYPDEIKTLVKEFNKSRTTNIFKKTKDVVKWIKEQLKK